mgnify:CR=1 FL=1
MFGSEVPFSHLDTACRLTPLTLSEHDVDMALEILGDVLSKMEPTAPKEQA